LSRADPTHAVWIDTSAAFAAATRALPVLPEEPLDARPEVDPELIFVCRACCWQHNSVHCSPAPTCARDGNGSATQATALHQALDAGLFAVSAPTAPLFEFVADMRRNSAAH